MKIKIIIIGLIFYNTINNPSDSQKNHIMLKLLKCKNEIHALQKEIENALRHLHIFRPQIPTDLSRLTLERLQNSIPDEDEFELNAKKLIALHPHLKDEYLKNLQFIRFVKFNLTYRTLEKPELIG